MANSLQLQPADFTVLELGAGRGILAREILNHQRFPYMIVDRSMAMKERQRENLRGFDVQWRDDLPAAMVGCVFSNEFFDALPVRRIVRRDGALREIYLTEEFSEIEGEPQEALDLPLSDGQLADISTDARRWVERIAASIRQGYHLAVDYGYEDREFYARPRGTLMCYWQHEATEDPYVRVGEQDITAHVNFSDLMKAGSTHGLVTDTFQTQMSFLIELGILNEMQTLVPAVTAEALQRLEAMKKLILPSGMGERFKVLVQHKLSSES
jgi:SAM-dependent MidA family methyltransferase